jgi:hypothetical protein
MTYPICKNCAHYSTERELYGYEHCARDIRQSNPDPVTGRTHTIGHLDCSTERAPRFISVFSSKCGLRGRFFKEKQG